MKKKIEKAIKDLKWFWHFTVVKYFSISYYIPNFVRNVWYFRKELNEYRTWDFHYSLLILHRSIELLKEAITDGYEVEDTLTPKVAAMEEVLYLVKRLMDEVHNDEARIFYNLEEPQWAYTKRLSAELMRKVYEKEVELENEDWDRILEIFKDKQKGIKTWWD